MDLPRPAPHHLRSPETAVDPAIQAAEVRQMLEAKASRLERRGERPIDVEAETTRLLGSASETGAVTRQDDFVGSR